MGKIRAIWNGVALAESCIVGGIGFSLEAALPGRWDVALFGEPQSLILVSVERADMGRASAIADEEAVPWVTLGTVGGGELRLDAATTISVDSIADAWQGGIESSLR